MSAVTGAAETGLSIGGIATGFYDFTISPLASLVNSAAVTTSDLLQSIPVVNNVYHFISDLSGEEAWAIAKRVALFVLVAFFVVITATALFGDASSLVPTRSTNFQITFPTYQGGSS